MLVKLLSTTCVLAASVNALWPAPQQYDHGSSIIWLSPDLQLVHKPLWKTSRALQWLWKSIQLGSSTEPQKTIGMSENDTSPRSGESIIADAFERMRYNIVEQNIVPYKFHASGSDFEPDGRDASHPVVEIITIQEVRNLQTPSSTTKKNPEAYSIDIDADGTTTIKVTSPQGALHALQTFAQLFFAHSDPSAGVYSPYAPLSILDSPTFSHRGLNLDISRNWIPPMAVMRTIEAMAATKLNKLHLHASDSQSWPLEIPALPELAAKGAYSPSQSWSVADLKEVQRHGQSQGVEVFLEIDLPGHTTAIGLAYPNLVTAANEEEWSKYALQPPSGQLKLNSSEVTRFISTLLDDLLPRTSRWTSKFHIGGDELNLQAYNLDPTVKSSSPKVLQPLVQAFLDHVISITQSHGLQPVVWEEMVLDWNLKLPDTITVQTWRSLSALNLVLAKGHKALFGSNKHWYLDCGFGLSIDPSHRNPDLADPERQVKPPYLDYCSPYKNWRHVYSYNPLEGVKQEHRHLIVGGEVHLWAELTDSVSLDFKLWPRVAAAAEVMWSGTDKMADEDTTRRLAEFRERLVARGVRADMVQTEWCLRNKGGCTL